MGLILLLLAILASSIALAVLLDAKVEEAIPFVVFCSILVLYAVGLFAPSLMWGVVLVILLYLAATGYVIFLLCKNRGKLLKVAASPAIIVWIILFLYILVINWGRLYSSWDEFSHWGLVVKNMYLFDAFSNHEYSTVTFGEYPPALALWQYFVSKCYGSYSESAVYMATGWFIASMCMPLVGRFSLRKWWGALASAFALLCLPLIFYRWYIVLLYVDPFQGVMLGYILLFDYLNGERGLFYKLHMFAALAVLCLVKSNGLYLAVVALGIIVVSDICKKRVKDQMAVWLVMFAGILFGKYSWTLYLNLTGFQAAWNTGSISMQSIIGLATGNMQLYQKQSILNFIDALSEYGFGGCAFSMYIPTWLAVFSLVFLFNIYMGREEKKKQSYVLMWGMLLGFVIYAVGLMVLYIFIYTEGEAVSLASFDRYMGTFLVAMVMVVAGVTVDTFAGEDKAALGTGIVICAMSFFLPLTYIYDITLYAPMECKKSRNYREEHLQVEQYKDILDYTAHKVMYISQEDNGIDKMMLKYMMTPVPTDATGRAWSLGGPYSDSDNYSANFTAEDLRNYIESEAFTHVYLFTLNDYFHETYSELFVNGEIVEKGMYEYDTATGLLQPVK